MCFIVLLLLLCAVKKRMYAKIEPHRARSVTYAMLLLLLLLLLLFLAPIDFFRSKMFSVYHLLTATNLLILPVDFTLN